jgi:UDP-glucose 4-epimerase
VTLSVLVSGGAGFIGSELVAQLLAEGHRVRILDNLVNGKLDNVREHLGPRCELIEADVRDHDKARAALSGVDIVYHLACLGVRHSIHSPLENHSVNAEGTLRLLMAAREREVGRFVYVSTSEVYGTARAVPMNEEHPTCPETVYGASKLAGEAYARAFFRTYRYPTVVVRPFNTFGPRSHHEGDSGEVIPKFLLRGMAGLPMVILGDGRQTRDFSYVTDTARGILAAGRAEPAIGQTLNLGSGREIAVLDLARQVAGVLGLAEAPITHDAPRPGDVMRLCADASRARELLGYEPRVKLIEGLARLRDWYVGLGRPIGELLAEERVRGWEIP